MLEAVYTTPDNLNLTLRPICQADAAALHRLCWTHLSLAEAEERVSRWLNSYARGLAWVFVAEIDGQVVGVGLLARRPRGAEICDLTVAGPWRGQGIGTTLIWALLEQAQALHIAQVEIGGAVSNPRAIALYERLGFRRRRIVSLDLGNGPEPVIYLSRFSAGE